MIHVHMKSQRNIDVMIGVFANSQKFWNNHITTGIDEDNQKYAITNIPNNLFHTVLHNKNDSI